MIFVDTNYFLRFLLADQEGQHQIAKSLFKRAAAGEVDLFTSLIVFFEVYWVLSSFYKKEKDELVEKLEGLLSMSFIDFQEGEVLAGAVRVFKETPLDLEDAYNLVYASANKATELKTFDQQLQKV
ncbi:MAG: PIN domain-containing protein, partial [Candidatus Uhrbacteria bacterium]|nr:PIN domain-containing protein [Candidatus Uhrbacteria bacterium]